MRTTIAVLLCLLATLGGFCLWPSSETAPPESIPSGRGRAHEAERESPKTEAGERSRVDPEITPAAMSGQCGVRVLSAGAVVDGATVEVGALNGEEWRELFAVRSDSRGLAAWSDKVIGPLGIRIDAPGFELWSGRRIFKSGEYVDVYLIRGHQVSGRVVSSSGEPVPGVRVRALGRKTPWPVASFVSPAIWPDRNYRWKALEPIEGSYSVVADAAGEFSFAGLLPKWRYAVLVDDPSWVMDPIAKDVSVDVTALVLTVYRSTGVVATFQVPEEPGAANPSQGGRLEGRVLVTPDEGMAKSFALRADPESLELYYRAPDDWSGRVRYELTIHKEGIQVAGGSCVGDIGAIAQAVLKRESPDKLKTVYVQAQWADGAVCDSGLFASAVTEEGARVRAAPRHIAEGRYEIEVPPSATRIEILAKDCFRSRRDSVVLDVYGSTGSVLLPATMPAGAEVVIEVPSDNEVQVMIDGDFGSRSVSVRRSRTMKSVRPGLLTASCRIRGETVEKKVTVIGQGRFLIDFTN